MRGTFGDFKCDVDGSDKGFGFVLPPSGGVSDTVAVFESAVDALSHQVLFPNFHGWRLSLGCVALAALTNFLERHDEVKNCVVCVDNDIAGNKAAAKIADMQGITVTRVIPSAGKDWNDALKSTKSKPSLMARLETAKNIAAELNGGNQNHRRIAHEWG
jgi:hypothetical protein